MNCRKSTKASAVLRVQATRDQRQINGTNSCNLATEAAWRAHRHELSSTIWPRCRFFMTLFGTIIRLNMDEMMKYEKMLFWIQWQFILLSEASGVHWAATWRRLQQSAAVRLSPSQNMPCATSELAASVSLPEFCQCFALTFWIMFFVWIENILSLEGFASNVVGAGVCWNAG